MKNPEDGRGRSSYEGPFRRRRLKEGGYDGLCPLHLRRNVSWLGGDALEPVWVLPEQATSTQREKRRRRQLRESVSQALQLSGGVGGESPRPFCVSLAK